MTWPRSEERRVGNELVSSSVLVCVAVTVAVAVFDVTPLPDAVAVLVIDPASRSACVMVCVEVQLVRVLVGSGPVPHGSIVPCLSSTTLKGPAKVTLPVFFTA